MKRIFFAAFFAVNGFLFGFTTLACETELTPSEGYRHLKKNISKIDDTIQLLERDASFVYGVNKDIQDGGNTTAGVFSVNTPKGKAAIKFAGFLGVLEKDKYSIAMQEVVGELGYAPRVFGVLKHDEIAKLVLQFPQLAKKFGGKKPDYALIMEEVSGAWSLRSGPPPLESRDWNRAAMIEQFRAVERVLNQLRIRALDLQFLISQDGRVYAFDFDRYQWVSKTNRAYGYATGIEAYEKFVRFIPFPLPLVRNDVSAQISLFEQRMDSVVESAVALIRNLEGRKLVLLRSEDDRSFPNVWSFPGGKLDAGETPEEAIVREVLEETGLRVKVAHKIDIQRSVLPNRSRAYFIHTFEVELVDPSEQVVLSSEHSAYKWVSVEESAVLPVAGPFTQRLLERE